MHHHPFRKWLTELGVLTAHPSAFLIVLCYGVSWLVFDPGTFNWHAVATLATWLMTLVIQRAEYRDTQALHAKLDALLRANVDVENRVTELDDEDPEDIEQYRERESLRSPR